MMRQAERFLCVCWFQAVAVAAAVVNGIPPAKCCPLPRAAAKEQVKGKENMEPSSAGSAEATVSTASATHETSGGAPTFRWPLLFQMVRFMEGDLGSGGLLLEDICFTQV